MILFELKMLNKIKVFSNTGFSLQYFSKNFKILKKEFVILNTLSDLYSSFPHLEKGIIIVITAPIKY